MIEKYRFSLIEFWRILWATSSSLNILEWTQSSIEKYDDPSKSYLKPGITCFLACESYFMFQLCHVNTRVIQILAKIISSIKIFLSPTLRSVSVDHDRLHWSLKINIPWHHPALSVIIIQCDPSKNNENIFLSVSLIKSIKQLLCQISKRWWVTFHRKKFTPDSTRSPTRFLWFSNYQ